MAEQVDDTALSEEYAKPKSPFTWGDRVLAHVVAYIPWIIVAVLYLADLILILDWEWIPTTLGVGGFLLTSALLKGGWIFIENSKPASIAMATFAQRRVPYIYSEGTHFTLKQLRKFLVDVIKIPVEAQNIDFKFQIRCRLDPLADRNEESDEEGKPAPAPMSGGMVEAEVSMTIFADNYSGNRRRNKKEVFDRLYQYINMGGTSDSRDPNDEETETKLQDIYRDIVGEILRRQGAEKTWQEMTFAQDDINKLLLKSLTGVECNPQTYESEFRHKKGLPDVKGLGSRVQRLNLVKVNFLEDSTLSNAADLAAKEQLERDGQVVELDHFVRQAKKLVKKSKKLVEGTDEDPMSFDAAMVHVKQMFGKPSQEISIKSSGDKVSDLGAMLGLANKGGGS